MDMGITKNINKVGQRKINKKLKNIGGIDLDKANYEPEGELVERKKLSGKALFPIKANVKIKNEIISDDGISTKISGQKNYKMNIFLKEK